jgi:hypothetical protein
VKHGVQSCTLLGALNDRTQCSVRAATVGDKMNRDEENGARSIPILALSQYLVAQLYIAKSCNGGGHLRWPQLIVYVLLLLIPMVR